MKIFVIMPISQSTEKHTKKYWSDFYKRLEIIILDKIGDDIRELFKTDNITVERTESPQGNIVKHIIENLNFSDLVIAVLTDNNVNVFYELGIRHALRNNTIMLNQSGQKIPFDLNSYGVGFYNENKRFRDIERELKKRLKLIAENRDIIDNPVSEFLKSNEIEKKLIPIKKNQIIDDSNIFDIEKYLTNKELQNYTQLIFDFKINSLNKTLGINYLKYQKHFFQYKGNGHIIYLPYIISPNNKIKSEPFIEYYSKDSYYRFSNWNLFDKLYFYDNKITYSSIELAGSNFVNLTTNIPFSSITYILYFLKEMHNHENLKCDIDINIKLISNFPVKLSRVDSPTKTEFFKLDSGLNDIYQLGENKNAEIKIKSFSKDDINNIFSSFLTLFISSNPSSVFPYMTINEKDLRLKYKNIFENQLTFER